MTCLSGAQILHRSVWRIVCMVIFRFVCVCAVSLCVQVVVKKKNKNSILCVELYRIVGKRLDVDLVEKLSARYFCKLYARFQWHFMCTKRTYFCKPASQSFFSIASLDFCIVRILHRSTFAFYFFQFRQFCTLQNVCIVAMHFCCSKVFIFLQIANSMYFCIHSVQNECKVVCCIFAIAKYIESRTHTHTHTECMHTHIESIVCVLSLGPLVTQERISHVQRYASCQSRCLYICVQC